VEFGVRWRIVGWGVGRIYGLDLLKELTLDLGVRANQIHQGNEYQLRIFVPGQECRDKVVV